jgi:hypothetical protein
MAHIIKTAPKPKTVFTVGQLVKWYTPINDRGMTTDHKEHTGEIIKVCPVNLHVKDDRGNIWSVSRDEVK